jgi:hypothetical protein
MPLEAATYIHQLVSTNPVGAVDIKAQGDDHLRLLKSTLQATFPNITGAVTVTHAQINTVAGIGITGFGNPSGTIGLAANNGVATTVLRSDATHALDQSIAPTWTATHRFKSAAVEKARFIAAAGTNLAVYNGFYRTDDATRRGYIGYGGNNNNTLEVINEEANGTLRLGTTGAGSSIDLRLDGSVLATLLAAGFNTTVLNNVIKDNEAITMRGANSYISWRDNSGATRYGYAQMVSATGELAVVCEGAGAGAHITLTPGANAKLNYRTQEVGWRDLPYGSSFSSSSGSADSFRGQLFGYSGVGGHTLTIDDTITGNGIAIFVNAGSGNLSVAPGAGDALNWFTGAGIVAGTRTLVPGGVISIYRQGANNFWCWGTGIL